MEMEMEHSYSLLLTPNLLTLFYSLTSSSRAMPMPISAAAPINHQMSLRVELEAVLGG